MTRVRILAIAISLAFTPAARASELAPGASLGPGQSIQSPDGRFALVLQADGNLVWAAGGRVLWHAGTHGTAAPRCVMQADGNLVVYGTRGGAWGAVWASGTAGRPGARLVCQSDRNLVLYSGQTPLWASNTAETVIEARWEGGAAPYRHLRQRMREMGLPYHRTPCTRSSSSPTPRSPGSPGTAASRPSTTT